MSAHSRHENFGPPAGPRGYNPVPRVSGFGMRGRGRGSFGGDSHIRPDTSSWGSVLRRPEHTIAPSVSLVSRPAQSPSPSISSGPASTREREVKKENDSGRERDNISIPTGPSASSTSSSTGVGAIPTGPRAGVPPTRAPNLQHSSSIYSQSRQPSFSHPSSHPPQPRPHPALANIPVILPHGKIDPTASGISKDVAARLKRKEEEAEVLREELNTKSKRLREGLRDWERLARDAGAMGLRSELSERHVRGLAGEMDGGGGGAF